MVKIIIDHGDVIYSLMFITESRGVIYTSKKAGGMAGGNKASEVNSSLTPPIDSMENDLRDQRNFKIVQKTPTNYGFCSKNINQLQHLYKKQRSSDLFKSHIFATIRPSRQITGCKKVKFEQNLNFLGVFIQRP